MSTIPELQEELIAEFNELGDGFEQYSYLIELSACLPPFPTDKRTEDRLVRGCQSHVWLDARVCSDGTFTFDADSDTLIIKGVLAVLHELFAEQPAAEVAASELTLFARTQLMETFSDDRQKGIGYIVQRLQSLAERPV
jgi:cysteine desulfuration protein SufE